MSAAAFAGWVTDRGERDVRAAVERMLAPRTPDAEPVSLIDGAGWALAVRGTWPAQRLHRGADGDGLLVVGAPRIDAQGTATAEALTRGRLADVAPRLEGAFLVARFGVPGKMPLEIVTDRFASHPVYYAVLGDGIVVGSDPSIVARHPDVGARIAPQAIYDFLYLGAIPVPGSVFEGVRCVRPASVLRVHGAHARESAYWTPAFDPRPLGGARRGEAEERMRSLLRESVRAHVADPDATGCFLSGGLDSSSVVGMVREVTGERPQTFSIGFATDDYDELDYARLVARHFDARHHEYYVTPDDIVELMPRIATAYGQPFGNSSVVPTWHCARLAREHGVSRLLAGDGGDELFGGNERYAEQLVFNFYSRVPAWVRQRAIEPALPLLDRLSAFAPARKLASYVRQAAIPLPDRLERYNYLRRIGESRILSRDFLATVDPSVPERMKREAFLRVQADSDVNRMLGLDFEFTLTDSDLPKVRTMCSDAGVDVRFPFLERTLVEFAASLPVDAKTTMTRLRGFFKDATRGFLPDEVIAKRKHGFGLPFGIWMNTCAALRDLAYSHLDAIAGREIARREFVGELKDSLVSDEPRYYGPLVWNLVMLEMWMEQHDARTLD